LYIFKLFHFLIFLSHIYCFCDVEFYKMHFYCLLVLSKSLKFNSEFMYRIEGIRNIKTDGNVKKINFGLVENVQVPKIIAVSIIHKHIQLTRRHYWD